MAVENRPDPDRLLSAIQKGEERASQGRLKVFLGMAAGVGKTYAMLSEARELRARGVDVVVGVAETHGRSETEALLEGLPSIPMRDVEVGPAVLREFDLDAALARRPEVILLDELAHTNSPGSRHPKRWQDAMELVQDGIGVHTCLNVQHVESLNDVVAQITGVAVRETVPDAVLERADRIELVDLPPEELLQRLREGKAYIPAQAERAMAGFFRAGNLLALRELALRQTAQRVEAEMETYRTSKSISNVWPAAPRILACVSEAGASEQVVRTAWRMAGAMHADCLALHVRSPLSDQSGDGAAEASQAFALAEAMGMQTAVVTGTDPVERVLHFARMRNVSVLVVGRSARPGWRDWLRRSRADELIRRATDMDVHVVTGERISRRAPQRWLAWRRPTVRSWLETLAALAGATLIGFVLHRFLDPTNLVMVYLAAVAVVAARAGPAEAAVAAVAGMLAFNFCFVPPLYTFAVSDARFLLTFGIMLGVSHLIGSLSTRFRQSLDQAEERERRAADLYALSRELTRAHRKTEIADAVRRRLSVALGADVGVLYTGDEPRRQLGDAPCAKLDAPDERAVAEWAADHSEAAGQGTATLTGSDGVYVPLRIGDRSIGALAVYSQSGLDAPSRDLATAYADLGALALERTTLAKRAQAAHLATEQEKLRNALLSSVSHDLRTPLTTVVGASETMLNQPHMSERAKRELVTTIHGEATRLSRLVNNLLQMTRLEAGEVALKGDWVHLEELIGGALEKARQSLADRPVTSKVEPRLPLLYLDPVLIEQVLVNLIENAVRYSPAGSEIEIRALPSGNFARVELRDHGHGFPPGREEEMFERFTHGPSSAPGDGSGLGLTICRAIVEAHRGRVWARNHPDGGASVIMEFPLTEGPPSEVADD